MSYAGKEFFVPSMIKRNIVSEGFTSNLPQLQQTVSKNDTNIANYQSQLSVLNDPSNPYHYSDTSVFPKPTIYDGIIADSTNIIKQENTVYFTGMVAIATLIIGVMVLSK